MIHEQEQFAAYVGLDWGDRRHSVHLQVAGDRNAESFELEQKPEALHEWVARLLERFQGRRIAIAIEQRKGAVIHALMMYAFLVLYPINPKRWLVTVKPFTPAAPRTIPPIPNCCWIS